MTLLSYADSFLVSFVFCIFVFVLCYATFLPFADLGQFKLFKLLLIDRLGYQAADRPSNEQLRRTYQAYHTTLTFLLVLHYIHQAQCDRSLAVIAWQRYGIQYKKRGQ